MRRLLDDVQIAFSVVLMVIAILGAAQAISTMRDISDDVKQGRLHHNSMLQQSEKALADHDRARDAAAAACTQMLQEHQAQMRLLQQR
jgi:hypothetical protein